MKKIDLFCLPFAGASKYCYKDFHKAAPANINLITLEYPGRGSRIIEPLILEIERLVDDMFILIKKHIKDSQYGIFGHSLGGLTGYLLTRKILDSSLPPPSWLFIAGNKGPSSKYRDSKKYLLGKKAFFEEIKKLQGCPEEILNNREMFDYFEPILRADFQISETYIYKESKPLDIPFTVITGSDEDLTEDEIKSWQKESSLQVDFKKLPGNHFFIFDSTDQILEIIRTKIFN